MTSRPSRVRLHAKRGVAGEATHASPSWRSTPQPRRLRSSSVSVRPEHGNPQEVMRSHDVKPQVRQNLGDTSRSGEPGGDGTRPTARLTYPLWHSPECADGRSAGLAAGLV